MIIFAFVFAFQESPKLTAMDVYQTCLLGRANELDDGISDASTIGEAVALMCNDELRASVIEFAEKENYPTHLRSKLVSGIEEKGKSQATNAVLRVRAAKRKAAK